MERYRDYTRMIGAKSCSPMESDARSGQTATLLSILLTVMSSRLSQSAQSLSTVNESSIISMSRRQHRQLSQTVSKYLDSRIDSLRSISPMARKRSPSRTVHSSVSSPRLGRRRASFLMVPSNVPTSELALPRSNSQMGQE